MGFLDFFSSSFQQKLKGQQLSRSPQVAQMILKLEGLPLESARHHALFACLLGRVAGVDFDISQEEKATMHQILTDLGHLDDQQAQLILDMALRENELFGGVENFLISKEFEAHASENDKLELLDCLFAVASAHDGISTPESEMIRQISMELKIDHATFIRIRSRYRDHLNILKDD